MHKKDIAVIARRQVITFLPEDAPTVATVEE
jgi:hypothetical protein